MNGALLVKPRISVADATWFDPAPWTGAVVTFTQGETEIEVVLTATQCRRLAKSLLREAERAD